MTERQADVVVIGAGIVGIACAAFLQRDGRRVTVLDPGGPGKAPRSQCRLSQRLLGGAGVDAGRPAPGCRAGCSIPAAPWRSAGAIFPTLAPWLWRFVRAGQPEKVRAQARALPQPSRPTVETILIWRGTPGRDLIHPRRSPHRLTGREESFAKDAVARGCGASSESSSTISPPTSCAARAGAVARLRPRRMIGETGHVGDPPSSRRAPRRGVRAQRRRLLRERALGFERAPTAR